MSANTGPIDARGYTVNKHGAGGYSRGCRCTTCKTGRTEQQRGYRAAAASRRRAAEAAGRVYVAPGVRHGSLSSYSNASCRCDLCRKAKRLGKNLAVPVSPAACCVRCKSAAPDGTCCSSHNALLCHRCYRRTHFVERCSAGCQRCAREGLDPMKWPAPVAAGRAS